MHYDVLIKNGMVVTSKSVKRRDIAIQDGKISLLTENSQLDDDQAKQVIDAEGKHVFPGLIDTHVHLNEPGRTEWEGFETGSRSLAAGGVTTFVDMPLNSTPPVTNVTELDKKKKLAEEKSVIHPRYWGGLVPGNVNELESLHQGGVIGFKAFLPPSGIEDYQNADDETLFQGMKKIASLDSILAVHCESPTITNILGEDKQEAGKTSARDFVESRPIISEVIAVQKVIAYAEATGCRVHIVHASNRDVVEVVKAAQKRGLDVSVETCPHYLALTVQDLAEKGGVAKCTPPLRDQSVVEDMWEAVKQGEIQVIGSDHSPSPIDMKNITDNYFEGWGGISGAQSGLNILLTEGYFKRGLPLTQIVALMSANQAERFHLDYKGTIAPGFDADITIVDLNETFTLKQEDLFYRHPHSPYVGKTFQGNVTSTIVGGNVVYQNGQFIR